MDTKDTTGRKIGQGGAAAHVTLGVLFLIYMSDYADRMILASMINYIKADWDITDAQAGWLVSVVLVFITVFTVPASLLIDRWSRRKMVAIMTFVWSLATLLCKFASGYWQLLAARSLIGVGESGYSAGGAAMLSAAYPEDKRARILGIWNASIPLGVAVGLAAGGFIAERWGWRNAFGLVALPGFALAVAAWFLPDYKSVSASETGSAWFGAGALTDVWSILKTPSLSLTYLGFAMNVSCTTAMAVWLPSYFERQGMAEAGKGGALATSVVAMVVVGAPLGGFLADWLHKRRADARLSLPALTSLLAGAALLLALQSEDKTAVLALLVPYGVLVTCFIAPTLAAIQDLVHPGLRALSIGLCVVIQHVAGDIWSPPLIGLVSDYLDLRQAMLFIPIYCLAGALCFYLAGRYYVRDLGRVERIDLEPEKR